VELLVTVFKKVQNFYLLFRVADAAIDFFDNNANPSERFAKTLERVGWDKLEKAVKEAYNG
jgi:dissimilatory sulfite reductase (desulfoviridin) alpha/beta subunit